MFKVECPDCKAPYQVDERRVPSTGLKMRCPKCGNSFQVDPPPDPRATGPSPLLVSGGAAAPKPGLPPIRKQTMLGVAGPSAAPAAGKPAGAKQTLLGTAPPSPGAAPKPPPRAKPGLLEMDEADLPAIAGQPKEAEEFADFGDIGLDLPGAPKVAPKPAPPPRPAAPRPPPAPKAAAPVPVPMEVDLPAPVAPKPGGSGGFGEIDLPAPLGAAPERPAEAHELDLPIVGGRRPAADFDLPARAAPKPGGAFGDLDLPMAAADLPAPAPRGVGGGFGELDLPALGAELPAIGGDLPSLQAGLPVAAAGLPVPAAGLPAVAAGLPTAAAGLPMNAAGLPVNAAGLPMNAATLPMNAATLPMNAAGLPVHGGTTPMGGAPGGFGEVDLGGGGGSGAPAPWGAAQPGADPGIVRQSGGGTAFGEVNLEAGQGGGPIDAVREEMEFRGLPQEGPAADGAQLQVRVPVQRIAHEDELAPPPKRKSLRAMVAAVVVLVLAGGALALVPNVGPFGVLWIYDKLKGGEYQKLLADTSKTARDALAKDTHPEAKRAYQAADDARSKNRRQKGLAAYAVYVAYGRELRFGADPEVSARASVLLDELKTENLKDVPNLELARAAHAAATGSAGARTMLDGMAKARPNDIDVLTLLGEVELKLRDAQAATAAWEKAEAVEKSARTSYGLARARFLANDRKKAEELAKLTLERNPTHTGARILTARATWNFGQEANATKLLEEVTKDINASSSGELVEAYTLLGEVHLARSRVTHAERAFSEALKIDPKSARALVGLGDALYRSGRYSEALARFEAAVQADDKEVTAKVGVAKTTLALERIQDAMASVQKLRTAFPKSVLVAYWYCRIQEAMGGRKEAESVYREVLKSGIVDPDIGLIYIGLAQLLNAQGKNDEAQQVLADARKMLPDSAMVRSAIGDIVLGQGKAEDAVKEYQAALGLDPGDVGAKFRLGVAYRRDKKFELASKTFDEVAVVDKEYPGLALERGLLFEASGRGAEALKAYEDALAKAPNDPDLMLRVGCGKSTTKAAKEAAEMISKVLEKRPTSAEAHHCKGKALLTEGVNVAEALRTLEKAVDLDPNRAEYHLYVAWAANMAQRGPRAETAVAKALELDQGLADAYWQRGVLRKNTGAVKDAVKDLKKALELKPTRTEAHAELADCYYDMGKEAEALAEYQIAVEAQPENATWRFRYGKLLGANNRNADAETQLTRALELAAKAELKPTWEGEANLALARAMGERKEAIPHWEAFLRLSAASNPYRAEAKKVLTGLGKPWEGN